MYDVEGIEWYAALVGALLIGASKTGLPGAGILAIPLFAAILPAKASTGVVLPMLVLADVFAVVWYRQHAVWRHLVQLFPWTMAGVVLGYFLLQRVSDQQLRPIIGLIILAMLGVNFWRSRPSHHDCRIPETAAFAAPIGLLAGTTTMMANAAGPVMTIYLLAMRLPKTEFVGTGAWYFFIMNLVKVPFSTHLGLINAESLRFNLMLAPAVGGGALLGRIILQRIPEKPFNFAVQMFAALGALRLLW